MGADRPYPGFEETLALAAIPMERRGATGAVPVADAFAFDATIAPDVPPAAARPSGSFASAALPTISVDSHGGSEGFGLPGAATQPDLRVLGVIGEGGMGRVHVAEQRSLAREVALKTLRPDAPEAAAAALCEEARITGQLEHPSVIPVHALGRDDSGRPVMVMKRVEGVSWKALLASPDHPVWENISGSHGLSAHLQILVQVCHAVAFAHSRGFVHRDLKPENVMIGRFGEVYVVDWGLATRASEAAASGAHQIVGTPAYMAPEMVAGLAIDERTDVYLLGAILHELVTGAPPHRGDSLMMVLSAAYESAPKAYDASVPDELASLCRDALARDPAARPRTAREFQSRLVLYLQHRASTKLARRARERLRAVEARDVSRPEERREVRRALDESRFAFLQALEEWPGNEAARDGLRACAERAVGLEVAEGHASAARLALEAIDSPPEALVREVEALEARLARERAEAERLRLLAHDLDASVGAGARRRAALFVAALCAVVSAVVTFRSGGAGVLSPEDLVRTAAFMVAAMATLVAIFRRRLIRNAFGRKIAALAFLASVTMLVHRILALLAGQPMHVVLATDSLLFSVMLVVAAVTLAPFLGAGAVFTFAGAFAILAYPAHATWIFTVTTMAMTVTSALLFRPAKPVDGGA